LHLRCHSVVKDQLDPFGSAGVEAIRDDDFENAPPLRGAWNTTWSGIPRPAGHQVTHKCPRNDSRASQQSEPVVRGQPHGVDLLVTLCRLAWQDTAHAIKADPSLSAGTTECNSHPTGRITFVAMPPAKEVRDITDDRNDPPPANPGSIRPNTSGMLTPSQRRLQVAAAPTADWARSAKQHFLYATHASNWRPPSKPGETSADAVRRWIKTSSSTFQWPLKSSFLLMRPDDLVWAYEMLPGDQTLFAVARVKKVINDPAKGGWFVRMEWISESVDLLSEVKISFQSAGSLRGPLSFTQRVPSVQRANRDTQAVIDLWIQTLNESRGGAPGNGDAQEGERDKRVANCARRSRTLAQEKKRRVLADTGRLACEVCDRDSAESYGDSLAGIVDVHHKFPLSKMGVRTTQLEDLVVLCPTCHRAVHSFDPVLTTDELRGRWTAHAGAE
jgi:hypothetical protein